MPEFAPCTIKLPSGLPLGAVYQRTSVDNTGAVASVQYWNHATEAWEAGPMDPTKHVVAMGRQALVGPESNIYVLAVAKKPVSYLDCDVAFYELDAGGSPTTPREIWGQPMTLRNVGLE